MCGINGILAYQPASASPSPRELLATRDAMAARGPDGVGEWWSADGRCALGHRRLAIIDLSDRAAQPMLSGDGKTAITYNGEIYNYRELRQELLSEGAALRTTSDTEVLLHLYARHGREMVHRLRGMFAFAIFDARRSGLFLARDPYGIKPLYYADDGWTFRFASQVKALLAGGGVSREIEPAGLVGFCLYGSVPEPFTLHRDIRALPAGHTMWVGGNGPREPQAFASVAAELKAGAERPAPAAELEAHLREAALESARAHLVADVEVGVFLSAGVDSGAVLGLVRDAGQARVRAVTLGFSEFDGTPEDETPLAADVAGRYGAEHHVRTVGEAEFRADLPAILDAMDQPSIDGINTWFVAKAAREAGLKVALSGLGGDELLAGYPSFSDIPRWVRWMRAPGAVPGLGVLARRLAAALGLARRWPKLAGMAEYGGSYSGAYLLRRGLYLPFELAGLMDTEIAREGLAQLSPLARIAASIAPDPGSAVGRVAALESCNYMRNQLLRDSDWAGMAHSLEIRTPLVDFRLLRQLAAVIPALRPGAGKRALALAPSRPLPEAVARRAKTGFGVPVGHWLAAGSASKGAVSRAWGREVLANAYAMAG